MNGLYIYSIYYGLSMEYRPPKPLIYSGAGKTSCSNTCPYTIYQARLSRVWMTCPLEVELTIESSGPHPVHWTCSQFGPKTTRAKYKSPQWPHHARSPVPQQDRESYIHTELYSRNHEFSMNFTRFEYPRQFAATVTNHFPWLEKRFKF